MSQRKFLSSQYLVDFPFKPNQTMNVSRYQNFMLCKRNPVFYLAITYLSNWVMHEAALQRLLKEKEVE